MDFVVQQGFQGMEEAKFDALIQTIPFTATGSLDVGLELSPGNQDGLSSQVDLSKIQLLSYNSF